MRDGLDNRVLTLETYNGEVYAGGDFITDGGFEFFYHIARWDGDVWSGVAGGMSGGYWPAVTTFRLFDGKLIVGGQFLEGGGIPAPHIASWVGSNWEAVGDGTDDWVHALGEFQGCLVAGGAFNTAGGEETSRLAQWNGSAWSGYGDGVQDWVNALQPIDDHLYVGGIFQEAGGLASYYLARWDYDPTSAAPEMADLARASLRLTSPNPATDRIELSFELQGPAQVQLDLIDVQGRVIFNLHRGSAPTGLSRISASLGEIGPISPGVYFARLTAGREEHALKVMVAE